MVKIVHECHWSFKKMSESCRSCPSTLRVKYTLFPFVAIHYALQGSSNFWGTIQMKATEQFFPVVLFIILYKVVLTFESVDQWNSMVWLFKSKQLKVLSCGTIYYTVQGGSNCWVWGWNPFGVTIQVKATEQFFPVVLFIMLYKVVLTVKSVDEILWCDHLNESNWADLSCGNFWVW